MLYLLTRRLASISPLNDEHGKLLFWIGYIVDINAQKLVEETLQDNEELKKSAGAAEG